MYKATILFADNDEAFLNTRTEFLTKKRYRVIAAKDSATAREALEGGGIDLAIIDVRLQDDDDERDTSGVNLAIEVARSTPKIILTAFPTTDTAVAVLKPGLDGLPAAVEYVDKREGPDALLRAVQLALGSGSRWLRQVEQAITGTHVQLEQDHDSAQRQSTINFIVSLFVAVLGILVIFVGVALALADLLAIGIASTIGGVVTEAVSYLFFNRADKANDRMDRYHEERIQGQRFNTILQACEGLDSESTRERCRERVIMAAAGNWLGAMGRDDLTTLAASNKDSESSGD